MNDTTTLINKVKAIGNQVDRISNQIDRANHQTLRTQELRRIMHSQPKTNAQKVDIVDALRMIANDINPSVLR